MKYWFDTEFIEDGKTIDLISIGIVAEDGRNYYAISSEYDPGKASQWVVDNVLSRLEPQSDVVRKSKEIIKDDILSFCSPEKYGKPQFWAYYADYDWVVLCQLFGTMMDLPKKWPMYCLDIKQLSFMIGDLKLPEQGKGEHNALSDAKWNRRAWYFLIDKFKQLQTKSISAQPASEEEAP